MLFCVGYAAPSFSQVPEPYVKLLKGEAVPYDTAVAMSVKTYRAESVKMEEADKVIGDLQISVNYLRQTLYLTEDKAKQDREVAAKIQSEQNKQMQADAKTKQALKNNFAKLSKNCNSPRGFWRSPVTWGVIGGAIGTTVGPFVVRSLKAYINK